MEWLAENWTRIPEFVGYAAGIAAVTPWKQDDKWVGWIMKIVDFVGLNWGFAKNAADEKVV